jgi:hypothetical protein
MTQASNLVLENSLQVFFYDLLQEYNKKSHRPLPNEIIYYASLVMDNLGSSEKYFEEIEGKVKEKVLGLKLLESYQLPREKQKTAVKDIGETALVLCGYFSESLNKKIIDTKYYNEIGIRAYGVLDSYVPKAFDTPNFFGKVARHFVDVTQLITLISESHEQDPEQVYLIVGAKKAV